ncbi:MAG TPA: response regulator [Pyrinomonadaceae bacterium]|jgi:DNA-binding NtrC family response regulator|nr:response regulator [Pyrinomonadaceae bacterium]
MNKVRLLVIEDDQIVADALRLIMEDQGYEVAIANSGGDGCEQCLCGAFDLTITDVNLPDMSGLDVLSRLHAFAPRHPVIVITAQSTPEIVTTAKERGAMEVLSKPFLPSDIISLVRRVACGPDFVMCG